MAVTQQLARVAPNYLVTCRRLADASPEGDPHWGPPTVDVLDLDWAPALLVGVGTWAGLDDVHLYALRLATNGDSETALDLAFLNTPPHAIGPFGPAPTSLSAAQVARVAELLGQIDMPSLVAGLPADGRAAASLIGHGADLIVGGPGPYVLKHFEALRDFYRDAARRELVVVLWWD
ncbi:DUF1877 domain-containing protein [Streptomyces tritici]|uniref:DUF1877 domain-containing protein n=1 Tax=Streptomyces tritici TaxID=2054410 RepID=UPI003AEF206B